MAVDRGWLTRVDAVQRCLSVLRFFRDSDQSGSPEATGFKGFYYHFLDMQTGVRLWRSELSTIDTALLIAGALTASRYFTANTPDETELRQVVEMLYPRQSHPRLPDPGRSDQEGGGCLQPYAFDTDNKIAPAVLDQMVNTNKA